MLVLGSLSLVPALAHADALDCFEPSVTISAPEDGASFEGAATIPVSVDVQANGSDAELTRVYVILDGVEAASMAVTMSGIYELPVMVDVGSHELGAGATDECAGEGLSDVISIEVTPPAAASTGEADSGGMSTGQGDTGDTGDTGGGDGGGGGDDGGCAVGRVPTRSWVGLSAFVVMVLGAWRLRRAGA
jgi:hypothetical protein